MAKVGTLLEIQQHLPLEDGRMLITSKGVERFQILRIVQERPVLVCEVEILKDQPGEDEKLVNLTLPKNAVFALRVGRKILLL